MIALSISLKVCDPSMQRAFTKLWEVPAGIWESRQPEGSIEDSQVLPQTVVLTIFPTGSACYFHTQAGVASLLTAHLLILDNPASLESGTRRLHQRLLP